MFCNLQSALSGSQIVNHGDDVIALFVIKSAQLVEHVH